MLCAKGTVLDKSSGICIMCKPGTYSLNPLDSQCSICPHGARCCGLDRVETLAGFWAPRHKPTNLTRCPLASTCLGVESLETPCDAAFNASASTQCASRHTGPICGSCVTGSVKQGKLCVECSAFVHFFHAQCIQTTSSHFIYMFL